ncbi:MAG: GNAT family N-acetyltransferase, partial [Microbacteriaceae bacterium]
PTHRRHGIARALLEAELRTANSLGIPVANLTVSEATIYSRYGFAPSAMAADLTIDTRRARWSGPSASGRLHFVSLEQVRDECRGIYGLARLQHPGDVALDGALWEHLIGTIGDSKDAAKHLRAVRYDDASGEPQGFAIYRVTGGETDFTTHTVSIRYLCAVTDDAYAGLWRYLLELDLVTTVDAPLRAVDEPVLWQLTDVRAVRATRSDHLWVRILDVKAALEARTYSAPGRIVLEIADPLGFANGRVLVTVDAHGAATVTPATVSPATGDVSDADAALSLTIVDLGALYLGGTSAHTLVRAGRVTELRPGSADAFDASFRSASAPWLSTWF